VRQETFAAFQKFKYFPINFVSWLIQKQMLNLGYEVVNEVKDLTGNKLMTYDENSL
jgi:hypothetical protein